MLQWVVVKRLLPNVDLYHTALQTDKLTVSSRQLPTAQPSHQVVTALPQFPTNKVGSVERHKQAVQP